MAEVWREASRSIGLTQSITAIAGILRRDLPVDRVLVRRIDSLRATVETISFSLEGERWRQRSVRTAYSVDDLERLLAWCRRGEVLQRGAGEAADPDAALIVPCGVEGEILAGPLATEAGLYGIVLLRLSPPQRFAPPHRALLQALLEPFARILENDQRLRELAMLREEAETQRRSLLARLGLQGLTDAVIGANGGLQPVMERVAMVAPSDVPVLILGETGSGKEVIARILHTQSPRARGPFIRVNCGAIPLELVDSELFGHEKGSFTGATATRRGWFERADAGTLFLDEIGELPPPAQVRLLRVLQDGLFERVGGEQQLKADVRIIAATHRNLTAMVQDGRFRDDLWYRLAVFPIVVPPLRERRPDIPGLAEHFARQAARRFGLSVQMPTPQDVDLLLAYDWPGNVRELAAVIDRAALMGVGKRLEVAKALGVASVASAPVSSQGMPSIPQGALALLPLDQAIRQHIEAALAATRGRIEGPHGAAALLKINPHTLRARMRKLKIDWAAFR